MPVFDGAGYAAIEPHPGVLEFFAKWAEHQPVPVKAVPGFWEDVIDDLGELDGTLFDTDPVSVRGRVGARLSLVHREGGGASASWQGVRVLFESSHPDALPESEAALIRRYSSEVEPVSFSGLVPPQDFQYYAAARMVVPICRR